MMSMRRVAVEGGSQVTGGEYDSECYDKTSMLASSVTLLVQLSE